VYFDEVLGDEDNISFSPLGISGQFIVGDIVNVEKYENSPNGCW